MSFQLRRGSAPLLISMPHVGTQIPDALRDGYDPRALAVEDTDWHLETLYGFADALGASVLVPEYSRYVIDLNRPPDDTPMYPGASNTELCPTRFFTGDPLYRPGREPDPAQRRQRLATYWQPYHDALRGEIDRLRQIHGRLLLWEAHSIRSEIPWLFDGKLPDLNFGTAEGRSAADGILAAIRSGLAGSDDVTVAFNGRFKGGYITRHYGAPQHDVHAVQLEMCQCLYMNESAPFGYRPDLAARIQPRLRRLVEAALGALPARHD